MTDHFLAEIKRIKTSRLEKRAETKDTNEDWVLKTLRDMTYQKDIHKKDRELFRALGLRSKPRVVISDEAKGFGGGVALEGGLPRDKRVLEAFKKKGITSIKDDKRPYVVAEPNSTILAHELGHLAAAEGGPFSRTTHVLRTLPSRVYREAGLAPMVGYNIAPNLLAMAIAGNAKGRALALPALIMAAKKAPTLINEADASIRGYKALKKMDLSKEDLAKYRRAMGVAYGTYVGSALTSMAIPYLALLARRAATGGK